MVSWKGAAALIAVLVAIGAFAYFSRAQPKPPPPSLLPCPRVETLDVAITASGTTVEVARTAAADPWRLVRPPGQVDSTALDLLLGAVTGIDPLNTISAPGPLKGYGLDPARLEVTCRVTSGASYTLSIGNQSVDSSGWYGTKHDGRVYVVPSSSVAQFDQALKSPPMVRASPSPAASPSP